LIEPILLKTSGNFVNVVIAYILQGSPGKITRGHALSRRLYEFYPRTGVASKFAPNFASTACIDKQYTIRYEETFTGIQTPVITLPY